MRRARYVLVFILVAAGSAWLFWPARWAINGPMLHILLGRTLPPQSEDHVLARLRVPPGFTVTRFAADLPNVRLLHVTSEGDILATQSRAGRVLLLRAAVPGQARTAGVVTLLEGLDRPHGIDWRDGWLYLGESRSIRRVRFDPATRTVSGTPETLVSGLPAGGNHWSRTLRVGPDGALYATTGASCNACIEDERRASMLRFAADGSGQEVYATGLRNSVGFDWHPETGDLYATDNGRDLLGDDFPPCELNRIVRGGFYGFPFANGMRVPDPDLGAGHEADVARSLPPVHAFRPHNAPLGITFLRRPQAPSLRGAALVALHGSWNRTRKDGYKVVSLHFGADGRIEERNFLTGFLENEEDVIGRPVDVAEGPDGALYVSDDYGGAVFRIAYGAMSAGETSTGETSTASAATGGAVAPSNATPTPPFPPEALQRGRALYEKQDCAFCHEAKRPIAGVLPRRLTKLRLRYDLDSLVAFLRTPTPPMPVPPLNDAERRDLAAYLLSLD